MNEYASVDGVIEAWVSKLGSTLFRGWAGRPARFFYLAGEQPRECFMVAISAPMKGRLQVQAASVDTSDGTEMSKVWEGQPRNLESLLRNATTTVESWKNRH